MHVLIMYAPDHEDSNDLKVVMVARGMTGTSELSMVSPVVTIRDGWCRRNGNPYGVYREALEAFTGRDYLSLDVDVFGCTSGSLERWV